MYLWTFLCICIYQTVDHAIFIGLADYFFPFYTVSLAIFLGQYISFYFRSRSLEICWWKWSADNKFYLVWSMSYVWKKVNLDRFLVTDFLLPLIALNSLLSYLLISESFTYVTPKYYSPILLYCRLFSPSSKWSLNCPLSSFSLLKTVLFQPSLSICSIISLVWIFRSEIAELWSSAHLIFHRYCKLQKKHLFILSGKVYEPNVSTLFTNGLYQLTKCFPCWNITNYCHFS